MFLSLLFDVVVEVVVVAAAGCDQCCRGTKFYCYRTRNPYDFSSGLICIIPREAADELENSDVKRSDTFSNRANAE